MKARLALAATVAALAVVPAAHADPYPQCDTTTDQGAVCGVHAFIAEWNATRLPGGLGLGDPAQPVRCSFASRRARRPPLPRWSCYTAHDHYVVWARSGLVGLRLSFQAANEHSTGTLR